MRGNLARGPLNLDGIKRLCLERSGRNEVAQRGSTSTGLGQKKKKKKEETKENERGPRKRRGRKPRRTAGNERWI
jgi:hypothetical protein